MRNAATVPNPWTTWSSQKKRARKPLQKASVHANPSQKRASCDPGLLFFCLKDFKTKQKKEAMCSTKSSIQMVTANDDSHHKRKDTKASTES